MKKEGTGRRGRRRKQLLDDFKGRKGHWKFKEEALDRTLWKSRLGRGYEPGLRGELSYLAPLGSEKITAPYFKQCFFGGGSITPQTESNITPPSPKTEITDILFYILNLWLRIYCSGLRGCDTREKEIVI